MGLVDPVDGSLDSQDPASRITTVEVRETPSPPTSPSTRSCDSSSSNAYSPGARAQPSGLTILDVTKARDREDEAERYMLLVSATSTVVWPLYLVGMSTACTEEMRSYVVGRLRMVTMETGIKQADALANILVEHHETVPEWLDAPVTVYEPEHEAMLSHMLSPGYGGVYGLGLSPLQVPLPTPEFGKTDFDMIWA